MTETVFMEIDAQKVEQRVLQAAGVKFDSESVSVPETSALGLGEGFSDSDAGLRDSHEFNRTSAQDVIVDTYRASE